MIKIDLRMDPKFCSNFKGITWGNGTKYSFFQENSLVEKRSSAFCNVKVQNEVFCEDFDALFGSWPNARSRRQESFFTEEGGGPLRPPKTIQP